MPRVDVPVQVLNRTGLALSETTGDATNHHSFTNDGNSVLVLRNNGATPRTITLRFNRTVDGQAVTAKTVALPASVTRYVGPFSVSDYGSSVQVDVDNADVRLAVIKVQG